MKSHWENFSTYYYVKETSLKRLFTVWFQLYDILEKQNCESKEKIHFVQGFRVVRGVKLL
jgi:hypothetical protein